MYKRISQPKFRYSPNGMIVNRNERAGQIDYDFYKGKGLVGMPGFNQRVSDQSRALVTLPKS